MAETKTENQKIQITVEQLQQAVQDYEMLLPSEVAEAYQTMLQVPSAGLKIAQALQQAMLDAQKGILSRNRVLDAAVLPAFLIGFLTGIGQQTKSRIIT
jgi:hypothetical protein